VSGRRSAEAVYDPRPVFLAAFRGALNGADAYRGVRSALRLHGSILRLGNRFVPADRYREIAFVALGNASVSLALAANDALGERITQGFVAGPTPLPESVPFRSVVVPRGLPGSPRGDEAATAVEELVAGLRDSDLLLLLLSPGALSTLVRAPPKWDLAEWSGFLRALAQDPQAAPENDRVARVLGSGLVGGRLARATRAEVVPLVLDRGEGGARTGGGPTIPVTDDERSRVRALLDRLDPATPSLASARALLDGAAPLASGPGGRLERPVVVASPADALRGASDLVSEKGWVPRLGALSLPGGPSEATGRFLEGVEARLAEVQRSGPPREARSVADMRLGLPQTTLSPPRDSDEPWRGVGVFAGLTLGLSESVAPRPAMDRFLAEVQRRLTRREVSVGVFATTGGDEGEAPAGAFLAAAGGSGATLPPGELRLRAGITDVGLIAVALAPFAPDSGPSPRR
jgi:glycerate-2-kinase